MPTLEYTVKRSPRARHVRLTVSAESGLSVVIPKRFDAKKIPAILQSKENWIAKKLEQVAERRRFFEPELAVRLPVELSLRAVGQEWSIAYREDSSKAGLWLRADGGSLCISGRELERAAVVAKLKEWLREKMREDVFPLVHSIADECGFSYRAILVKSQRTRWASCSSRKNLSLNTKLLFLPPELVRYVIVHELCHTVHLNHSAKFWRLVARHEAAYEDLHRRLREGWRYVPGWAG
jgi:predicted metal-dependent hydrolase